MGTSGYNIGWSGCNTGTQYWGMSSSDYSMSTFVLGCGMGISACNMVTSDSSIDTLHSDTGTLSCIIVYQDVIYTPQALV